MLAHINLETVASYAAVADQACLENLRKDRIKCICANYKDFSQTKECKKLFEEHQKLGTDIFFEMSSRFQHLRV
jgi:hypothetical protein